jgi:predicted TIM-barrel enzyme
MDMLTATFNAAVVLLPVVHVVSTDQAVRQAEVACNAGAPGVFLVNHQHSWPCLVAAADTIRSCVGGWVGANALDLTSEESFTKLCAEVQLDGIWTDNAGIHEDDAVQHVAVRVDAGRQNFNGLYFGGVAFKYQREVTDLHAAAKIAARHMDVVCTSGAGTGQAADPAKVAAIVSAASPTPTAVASGVDLNNIDMLATAGARVFLVASSISSDWTTLDPCRTRTLVAKAAFLAEKHASSR